MLPDLRRHMLDHGMTSREAEADLPAWPMARAWVGRRSETMSARCEAVERVITVMRKQPDTPLSLQDMADIALLSPFHFNRVFRSITGLPPGRFQTALRLERAKRLLLTTRQSVTDISFEVGYQSLSTFTNHFAEHVGMSPYQLRQLAAGLNLAELCTVQAPGAATTRHHTYEHAQVIGRISAPEDFIGVIFVGLFKPSSPQRQPAACAILLTPGVYEMPSVPDGSYHVFAAALTLSDDPLAYLLPDHNSLYVGESVTVAGGAPLRVRGEKTSGCADVTLRRLQLTDPPLLLALPLLLAKQRSV